MLKTLLMAPRLLTTVRNLGEYFRDRQGWLRKPEMQLKLRNDFTLLLRTGTSDRCVFNDIWLQEAYALPGLKYNGYRSIIDIGAHIGLFALFAASRSPKACVYAFEPEPQNFALLQRNVTDNHLAERVHIFPQGIGREKGTLPLHVAPGRGECNSSYRQTEESYVVTIPVTTLGDVFREQNIQMCDLMKVNCEGEEYNILLSLPDHIFDCIGTMIINYHFFSADPAKHPRFLRERLEQRGFRVSRHLRNVFLALRP